MGNEPRPTPNEASLNNARSTIITEENQITELSTALKEMMRQEILNAKKV